MPIINNVSSETREAIRRKSAYSLPNNPSDRGMKPEDIKKAFWQPILDVTNSSLTEIDRVVNELNVVLGSCGIVAPPYIADFDTTDFTSLSGTDYLYYEINATTHGRGQKPIVECIQKAIVSGNSFDYEEVFTGYKIFIGGKIWIISNEAFKGRAIITNGGI